jgi:hypothetical protein
MLVFGYPTGALGHTVTALLDSCTIEGGGNIPPFIKGQNLHHYRSVSNFYVLKHPEIDIVKEKEQGNIVISSTSSSFFGKLLINVMRNKKSIGQVPEFNLSVSYNQGNGTYGEQVSLLAHNLNEPSSKSDRWTDDVDYYLDVLSFWNNTQAVINFLQNCGVTPIPDRVKLFSKLVAETNQEYFDFVENCAKLATDVMNDQVYEINISFFELANCYAFLLNKTGKKFNETDLLKKEPTSTLDLIKIFKD